MAAEMSAGVPTFVLCSVIDDRLVLDEQLWDREQLRVRLAEVLPVRGYEVAWGISGTALLVTVAREDGMFLSSWSCPECGAPETCWDLRPTAEMVLDRLSSHVCDPGYVTADAGDGSARMAEAVADVLADDEDDVDEDEVWQSLPSQPVTAGYAQAAMELEALEAGEVAEVGEGFFDSLVLVDAMGVAL